MRQRIGIVRRVTALGIALAGLAGACASASASPLDPMFGGGDGVASHGGPSGTEIDTPAAMALQPDGKIVLAGSINHIGGSRDTQLIRLNPDGSLDESFGAGGKVVTVWSAGIDDYFSVAIAPDGKIVAVGSVHVGQNTIVARYNSDGSLDVAGAGDPTPADAFSTDGRLEIDLGGTLDDHGSGVIVQDDGKVVVSATVQRVANSGERDFGLLRTTAAGEPDTSWGTNGLVLTDIATGSADGEGVSGLVEQADGKLVAFGSSNMGTAGGDDPAASFARYNRDGTLDSGAAGDSTPSDAFGAGGTTAVQLSDSPDAANAAAVQPDGKIVAGGFARPNGNVDYDFGFLRLTAAGLLDNSGPDAFGTGGKVVLGLPDTGESIQGIAVQGDGKIVAAGNANGFGTSAFNLVRLTPAGGLDAAFDFDGRVLDPPDGRAIALAATGTKLLAGGPVSGQGDGPDFAVARYHQNDVDSDGRADDADNCPNHANPGQADNDGDGHGDVCDADDDNDGVADASDGCPAQPNATPDGCPAPPDADGDGIADASDACPATTDAAAPRSPRTGCPADPEPISLPGPTNGDDTLNGTTGSETLCGLLGNDVINGLQGDDTLFGDACSDTVKLGSAQATDGNDTLHGSEGDDKLFGAGGRDKLDGGAGNDRLDGGRGNDSLSGGAGNDALKGSAGNDSLNGGAGKDSLDGGAGNDKLNGGASRNGYKGGAGNDTIAAANGQKETVDCGSGRRDVARVDRTDKVKGCETVKRTGSRV